MRIKAIFELYIIIYYKCKKVKIIQIRKHVQRKNWCYFLISENKSEKNANTVRATQSNH